MAQGQEGDFQGCGEGGELCVGERRLYACCATVFSGGVEVVCDDLILLFLPWVGLLFSGWRGGWFYP